MAYVKNCEPCRDKCPQAARAHEAAAGRMSATKEFIALQKKIESGQLVEVVRCKDCKHYAMWTDGRAMNHCDRHDRTAYDNDFCSYRQVAL